MNDNSLKVFASTVPGEPVTIQDDRYEGRLKVKMDGSLVISGLTEEDRGVYRATIQGQKSERCEQLYNLTVVGETLLYAFTEHY